MKWRALQAVGSSLTAGSYFWPFCGKFNLKEPLKMQQSIEFILWDLEQAIHKVTIDGNNDIE